MVAKINEKARKKSRLVVFVSEKVLLLLHTEVTETNITARVRITNL
jgi:hypothetical protein